MKAIVIGCIIKRQHHEEDRYNVIGSRFCNLVSAKVMLALRHIAL